jgi:lipopolysaccharide exporter
VITRAISNLPTLDSGKPSARNKCTEQKPLVQRVRRGAIWTAANTLLLRFSNIAVMAVVARIVSPEELGVFALAIAIQLLLADMAALGVSSAIARSDLDEAKIAPTVITISIFTSLMLGLAMALLAPNIAAMVGSPQATDTIRILAIALALVGPFAVPSAQLQRRYRQDILFRATAISFLPSSAVLLMLALLGDGAVAFAWSRVVGQLLTGLIILFSVEHLYGPGLNPRYARGLIAFGLPIAMTNVLSQALLNMDYVFIGRLMSTSDVGLYMLAFNVSTWSTALIGSVLNGMVLPAFSQVKLDGGNLSRALAHATGVVGLIACPIAGFTFVFAHQIIGTIYGSKWTAAAPALALLSLYGVFFVIALLLANVLIALGSTAILFVAQIAGIVVLAPLLMVGVTHFGLIGAAIAHVIVITLVMLPTYLLGIRRSIGATIFALGRALRRPSLATAVASISAFLVSQVTNGVALQLAVGALTGALVYVALTVPLLLKTLPEQVSDRISSVAAPCRRRVARALRQQTN